MELLDRDGKVYIKNGAGAGCRPVFLDGKVIRSVFEARKVLGGISGDTVARGCAAGQLSDGRPIRYATREEVKTFVSSSISNGKRKKARGRQANSLAHQYQVDGVVYRTKRDCLADLHVSAATLAEMEKVGLVQRVDYATYRAFKAAKNGSPPTSPNPVSGPKPKDTVFEGVVWEDGGVTVRLPGTSFSMSRTSRDDLPREIISMCAWR
jgi:hypothetical protein